MLTSKDRILTTHCGSLPRPPQLSDLLLRQEAGESIDSEMLRRECADAVSRALQGQMQAGIDIVSDGEQPRVGFSMYIPLRMEGFGGESVRPTPRDLDDFPLYRERLRERRGRYNRIANPPKAIREVRYTGVEAARAEYELFKNALASLRQQPAETFMTAASPGIIATTMANEYYDSYEAYVFALARELRKEYQLISSYGFLLQLDAPDFGLERARLFKDKTDAEFLRAMELNIDAIIARPKEFHATGSGSTSAGATGRGRTPTIFRWPACCRFSIGQESAHSVSNSPIRGISTSMPHSGSIHCRPICS